MASKEGGFVDRSWFKELIGLDRSSRETFSEELPESESGSVTPNDMVVVYRGGCR